MYRAAYSCTVVLISLPAVTRSCDDGPAAVSRLPLYAYFASGLDPMSAFAATKSANCSSIPGWPRALRTTSTSRGVSTPCASSALIRSSPPAC